MAVVWLVLVVQGALGLTLPGRWRLSFNLENMNKVVTARFGEDGLYEPPKGKVLFEDGDDLVQVGRWNLSEDPDDRKDGLWVWGLFSEPLYPFLLMSLPSDAIGLPPGDTIAVKLRHKSRPDETELLSKGTVYLRKIETMDADLFGLAKAQYNEDTPIGTIVPAPLQEVGPR